MRLDILYNSPKRPPIGPSRLRGLPIATQIRTRLWPIMRLSEAAYSIQNRMIRNTVHQIQGPELEKFINNLISKLDLKKHSTQILCLTKIQQKLLQNSNSDLTILRLAVINGKNPIIRALSSLNQQEFNELKQIETPPFFKNFFKELSFYIKINTIAHIAALPEKIEKLIYFSKHLILLNEKSKAIRILSSTRKLSFNNTLSLYRKIELSRTLSEIHLNMGDKNNAIKIWSDLAKLIAGFSMIPSLQLKIFQELANNFIQVEDWSNVVWIMNTILNTPQLSDQDRALVYSEETNSVLQTILEKVLNQSTIQNTISLIRRLVYTLKKDQLVEKFSETLLNNLANTDYASKVAQCIINSSIKTQTLQKIAQKCSENDLHPLEEIKDSP